MKATANKAITLELSVRDAVWLWFVILESILPGTFEIENDHKKYGYIDILDDAIKDVISQFAGETYPAMYWQDNKQFIGEEYENRRHSQNLP